MLEHEYIASTPVSKYDLLDSTFEYVHTEHELGKYIIRAEGLSDWGRVLPSVLFCSMASRP